MTESSVVMNKAKKKDALSIFILVLLLVTLLVRINMWPVLLYFFTEIPLGGCYISQTTVNETNIKNKRCFHSSGMIFLTSLITSTQKEHSYNSLSYRLEPKRIDIHKAVIEYAIHNLSLSPNTPDLAQKWKPVGDAQAKVIRLNDNQLLYREDFFNDRQSYEVLQEQ